MQCVVKCVCVIRLSGFGHRLGESLGSKLGPDLQCVHGHGEMAADKPEARAGAALQGKLLWFLCTHTLLTCSLNYYLLITFKLIHVLLQVSWLCLSYSVSVLHREGKDGSGSWWLLTFTSATCQPGNTDVRMRCVQYYWQCHRLNKLSLRDSSNIFDKKCVCKICQIENLKKRHDVMALEIKES